MINGCNYCRPHLRNKCHNCEITYGILRMDANGSKSETMSLSRVALSYHCCRELRIQSLAERFVTMCYSNTRWWRRCELGTRTVSCDDWGQQCGDERMKVPAVLSAEITSETVVNILIVLLFRSYILTLILTSFFLI